MMKTAKPCQASIRDDRDAKELADFMLFRQSDSILRLSSQLSKMRLSLQQFFLLAYLMDQEGLSMSGIASMVGHTTAATTGMVDKLDDLGYTQRTQAISDRRRVLVQITQEGRNLVAKMRSNLADSIAEVMVNDDAQVIISNVNSRLEKTYTQAKAIQPSVKKTS